MIAKQKVKQNFLVYCYFEAEAEAEAEAVWTAAFISSLEQHSNKFKVAE